MFIVCSNNNGTKYLQVYEHYSVRINDTLESKKRLVLNIGPLSRFDDGQPDYLGRLRQSFRDGKPIIEKLNSLITETPSEPLGLELVYGEEMTSNPDLFELKNLGYLLLDGFYDALGIYDVLNSHKHNTKIEYDLNGIARLLIFGRILFPGSKLETFGNRDKFFFHVTKAKDMNEIYRALDALNETSISIQTRANTKIAQTIGRNTDMCFYDVTNYWFEIPYADPDTYDADNKLVPGFRKKGVSKENRKDPIVQMGLFTDQNGIPVSYHLFPGNTNDQVTLEPALLDTFDKMNYGRVIVVADGGLNSNANIASLVHEDRGHGYIFPRSVKKSNSKTINWLLDETGYVWNKEMTVKTKSIIKTRKIKDRQGNYIEVEEKIVGYWSKKFYDKEVHQHERTLDFLNKAIENPVTVKSLTGQKERFLIEINVKSKTGEIINDSVKHYELDVVKLNEYEKLFGYNIVFTSETKLTDSDILGKYHGLSRIEDSFRVTKSDLEGRPIFVRTKGHINAHFLICFCSLQMIRLIQYRILKYQGKETNNIDGWEAGLSADRIKKALNEWVCCVSSKGDIKLVKDSDDLLLIKSAFGVDFGFKHVNEKSIKLIKKILDDNNLNQQGIMK
jgi:transposase